MVTSSQGDRAMHGDPMTGKTKPPLAGWTIVQSILRPALPIASFYLTEILVGLTDLAVVGALGTAPLAAVGLGKTVLLSFLTIGFAVLSAGTVFMAEGPSPRRCGEVFAACLLVTLPFAAVALAIGVESGRVLAWGGYEPDLATLYDAYTGILAWAIAPAMIFAALKNVLNAVERTQVIFWLSAGIVLGNLAGSIVLVHGFGTWPGLGVAGAAWATVVVNLGAAGILAIHCFSRGLLTFVRLRTMAVLQWAGAVLRLGWAAGGQQGLESVLFVAVLFALGIYSADWLAAGTVVFAVMELNFALNSALGEVLAARLARLRALERRCEARRLFRIAVVLSGGSAAAFALLVAIFADGAVAIFATQEIAPATVSLMRSLLRWTAPLFVLDAWQLLFVHALRGLRRTVVPMIASASCYWAIGLGGGLLLAEPFGLGASGIWTGFCLGLAAAASILWLMTQHATGLANRPH